MFPIRMRLGIVFALMAISAGVFAVSNPFAPLSTSEAVREVANRLVATQEASGRWPAQGTVPAGTFTGTMAAGLAEAYWMTCNPAYRDAAEAAGLYIWTTAPGCALYADEAYAFMQLSEIACDPADNDWRLALQDFYGCVESQGPHEDFDYKAGTELYVAQIEADLTPIWLTVEVAYYTVAAYYIDTPQKATWRSELVRVLETANAPSGEQIMALGLATWALAQTDVLDATPGSIFVGDGAWTYGAATSESELPDLLASYQVPGATPAPYPGHFYSVYNPPNAGFSGWTETNMFAMMGLDAAGESDPGLDYQDAIDWTWALNMQAIDNNGDVWWDAVVAAGTGDNETHYHYAGEWLICQAAARLPGDVNLDDVVDLVDLQRIAIDWLSPIDCDTGCKVTDLNRDRKVNLLDFARLAEGWLMSRPIL